MLKMLKKRTYDKILVKAGKKRKKEKKRGKKREKEDKGGRRERETAVAECGARRFSLPFARLSSIRPRPLLWERSEYFAARTCHNP